MVIKSTFQVSHHLTTAEILYHMPDFPQLLQSYIWQEFDAAPDFPALKRFLDFWDKRLDGKIHAVTIASVESFAPESESRFDYKDVSLKLN